MLIRRSRIQRNNFLKEALPQMQSVYWMSLSLTKNHAVAEDLVQDTYREAWTSFARYEPGSNCKAWLFRILFRQWGKQCRSRPFREIDVADVPESRVAAEPGFDKVLEGEEILEIAGTLPKDYQTILVLADVEGFSYREISELLEIPIGTVMSRLNRARSLLRRKLSRGYQERNTA